MLPWCIVLLAAHICIYDLRFFKVRNRDTAILLILLFFDLDVTSFQSALSASAISICCFIGLRIGMGDLKLWLALVATQSGHVLSEVFLIRAVIVAGILMVANYLRLGRRSASIAFAPVLLIPFLSLYLGI
jgi:Flp pilus assembly protein protease CpaA